MITFHYYNSFSSVCLYDPLSSQKLKLTQPLYTEVKFMAILWPKFNDFIFTWVNTKILYFSQVFINYIKCFILTFLYMYKIDFYALLSLDAPFPSITLPFLKGSPSTLMLKKNVKTFPTTKTCKVFQPQFSKVFIICHLHTHHLPHSFLAFSITDSVPYIAGFIF